MAHTIYRTKDETRVKSVTTIIGNQLGWSKNGLIGWNVKLMKQGINPYVELKKAGRIGTLAHIMIEQFIKGGSVNLDGYSPGEISKAKTAYYGFYKWFKDNDVKFLETEMQLVSDKYKFGGTFDAVAVVNGKIMLLDWKTTNACHDEFIIQLAAYRQLWAENNEYDTIKIKGAILLRLDKDEKGVYEANYFKLKDLDWGWRIFKLILKIQGLQR